jgi:TetR/AcrR family transcriptional repressor of nem operon
VDALMADVDLTVGGFYAHFASKQELFDLAMDRAFADSRALLAQNLPKNGGAARRTAFYQNYLSRRHRDDIETGCAFPANGADATRAEAATRRVFERNLRAVLELMQERSTEAMTSAELEEALGGLATCIGGLLLARCVHDTGFSDQILRVCRSFLKSSRPSRCDDEGT